ncbi:MAG: hypothetical protein Q8M07_24825, partial [Prosthecobacter sp.]|nr:hypothetical protein [Prosthecobacter sp.]HBJ83359.1 hypothetical protein [Verrucomicrobiales bacterium]
MNATATLHTLEDLRSPEPGSADRAESTNQISARQDTDQAARMSNEHAAKQALKKTSGIRLAHVSWYHGGINE